MAESKRKTPKSPKNEAPEASSDVTALHIRNVPLSVVAGLDAMVERRRAELEARAVDALTRRFAAALSRNDVIVDILSEAVARSKSPTEGERS